MKVLLTGASGFLGTALIPKLIARGDVVYGLSRHPPAPAENLTPLVGDVTKPDLGLEESLKGIRAVYHLAAIHRLGGDRDGSIWETNVEGTKNVIRFCEENDIGHLFFCSTTYTQGRNVYEESKSQCEQMVAQSEVPKITIFKPSIVMGTKENPYPGHFSQFVALLIRAHRKAESLRRKVEDTLRLPVLEPVFRVKGDPDGHLNLVMIDEVVQGMARIRSSGVYWLTNPRPPTLAQLADWIGETTMVRFRFQVGDFHRTPLEAVVAREISAFDPYLWGDSFPSSIRSHPPITWDLIRDTIINSLGI